jgi:hypothetical protein
MNKRFKTEKEKWEEKQRKINRPNKKTHQYVGAVLRITSLCLSLELLPLNITVTDLSAVQLIKSNSICRITN